jgi:hypothetical protein
MPDMAAADTEDILRIVVPVFRGLIAPEEAEKPDRSESAGE